MIQRLQLRLREEFISTAAHEMRTPVTVIKGRAQMALRTDAHEEGARKALEAIDHQSERISRLADDLLKWSQSESHIVCAA